MNRLLLMALLVVSVGAVILVALTSGRSPSGMATGTLGQAMVVWTYPANDAVAVSRSWNGKDAPQPAAPPAGYPSGPVLTLQVGGDVALSVQEVTVVQEPSGELVKATIFTGDNDGLVGPQTLAIIPHEPLEPLTTYTVEVRATGDGTSFVETWSFTTRRQGCDLLSQDCNPGRGCFLLSTGKECLWAGRSLAGEACVHTNECAPGLTCLGANCIPFCDSRDEAPDGATSCAGRCPGGVISVPGAEAEDPTRLCVLKSCLKDPSICGAGEACYWIGTFLCSAVGEGKPGTTCAQATDCASGSSCLGHEGTFACRTLCGGEHMPACSDACGEEALLFDADKSVSFCP